MNLEFKLTPYMMSDLVIVKYMRLPTRLLNNVVSTDDPSSSLLNFKPIIIGVEVVLQLDILNLFKTALAYLECYINIPLSNCWTSMPTKYFKSLKSVFQIHFP